ncbi:MAG: hypothetical protein V4580_13675 [Bacteroidota bacterium]
METQSISIAKTILEQIQYADRWFLPAIGAKNFLALPESKMFQGGVRFKVNGLKHKGIVEISLRWVDDYSISFLSKAGDEIKRVEGVYCDMLVEVLDWIEGK